jgi:hypothetical protein
MNEDVVRLRLQHIADRTAAAEGFPPAVWWEGQRAAERRVRDDLAGGRLQWQAANRWARRGLRALEAKDFETATELAWHASRFYIDALENWISRVKPSELPSMEPAKLRGRKKKK